MNYQKQVKRLTLDYVREKKGEKHVPAKRVNIISVKMVKECSVLYKNRVVRSPEDASDLFRQFLGDVDREHFVVVCLNTKSEPTSINTCHIGSLNTSVVHPREVMKPAILSNAASVIHPSGNSEPSQEGIHITRRLTEADKIIGIDLLDHIVLGDDSYVSLK